MLCRNNATKIIAPTTNLNTITFWKKGINIIKQTEEKLIVSELRYRRLFETAQDGILILDADSGMIEDVNPFMMKMQGYSRKEFCWQTTLGNRFFQRHCGQQSNFSQAAGGRICSLREPATQNQGRTSHLGGVCKQCL